MREYIKNGFDARRPRGTYYKRGGLQLPTSVDVMR
jgi:hypothetical protein